jgi:hypothetical protein
MRTIFYIVPTCFGAIILPSSGTWHQNFFKTYSNKIGHNKHIYVVVLWPILLLHVVKEILKSRPWRWRDNSAETCRSYVKYCRHKVWNSAFVGVTWVICITMHGIDCEKAIHFRPIVMNWSSICQPRILHWKTKYSRSGHCASVRGCNLRYNNLNENHVNDYV